MRRPEQRARKVYCKQSAISDPGTSSSSSSTELTGQETDADPSESDDNQNDILDDWDTFMQYSADDSHSDSDSD